ncbi:MAG: hypothetical protein A2Z97_14460 [Bdellovibrionales bacterium GWB1_52_6]|nr:MAG: hypothetical protein A2Z97_14460 [Bdellovibrionales bacterium GWB1_52_6]
MIVAVCAFLTGVGLMGAEQPPTIESLLKQSIYKRMAENREVMVYAKLADVPETPDAKQKDFKKYSFYAAMRVQESLPAVRRALLDYAVYPKMIPYVDRAEYSASNRILTVEGGIWKFRLKSQVLMEEKSERWIHFRIIGGHFPGMTGDMFLEPMSGTGGKGTVVYFRGEKLGPESEWPPRLVIERGAEIVFGFTGGRMRSYIETKSGPQNKGTPSHDHEVPQPRSHF